MRKLIFLVVMVAACGGKKDEKKAAPHDAAGEANVEAKDGGGTKVAVTDGGAAKAPAKDGGGPPAKRVPRIERKQLDALLTAWLEAQNSGDFTAYSALYTDDFKGVRRSGKQTVRLDRAGWLKERKNMFSRPMLVAARDVEVNLGAGRASATFTQEWSSGKYHDVGPKVIEVVAEGPLLKISREELLASQIVKPHVVSVDDALPPAWPMYGNVIVLAGEVGDDWATGQPTLEGGEIPARDPMCDDDPPDYEEDQGRYLDCEASDPESGHAEFAASSKVDTKKVPKAFTALIGQKVRLSGTNGSVCETTIDHLEVFAEMETTFSAATANGSSDREIAATVLDGAPVLVAALTRGCGGDWAQLASAPVAPMWKREDASAVITKAARKQMMASGLDEYDAESVDVEVMTSPDGTQLVLGTRVAEFCFGQHDLTMVFPFDGKKVGAPVFDESDAGGFLAAVDTNTDGWPEFLFFDGVGIYADGSYDRLTLVDFPDEIEEECGE